MTTPPKKGTELRDPPKRGIELHDPSKKGITDLHDPSKKSTDLRDPPKKDADVHDPDKELLEDIKDVIDFYDKKGDNHIDVDQLGLCLRSLQLCPTEAQVAQYTQRWTADKEKRLAVADVAPIFNELRKEGAWDMTEVEINGFLSIFDPENVGSVPVTDLRHLLTRCGESLSQEEYELVVREDRAGEDGRLSIQELVKTLREGTGPGGGPVERMC